MQQAFRSKTIALDQQLKKYISVFTTLLKKAYLCGIIQSFIQAN